MFVLLLDVYDEPGQTQGDLYIGHICAFLIHDTELKKECDDG